MNSTLTVKLFLIMNVVGISLTAAFLYGHLGEKWLEVLPGSWN